jgi:hypothetical protein
LGPWQGIGAIVQRALRSLTCPYFPVNDLELILRRRHGAADQALADLGHALEPLEARLADRGRQRLRAAMGADAFEAEYAAGRTLTPEQIADLALPTRA